MLCASVRRLRYQGISIHGSVSRFLFQALFILSFVAYEGLNLDGYVFPRWAEAVGWLVTCSSLACIPAYIVYSFLTTKGPLPQVFALT